MSTPDLHGATALQPPADIAGGGAEPGWDAAPVDPSAIARLANQFFQSLPSGQSLPSAGATASAIPAVSPAPAAASAPVPAAIPAASPLPVLVPGPVAPSVPPSPAPALPQPGLNDNDLRAVPASLGGVMSLIPSLPGRPDLPQGDGGLYFLQGLPAPISVLPATVPTDAPKSQPYPLALELRPELVPDLGPSARPFDPRAVRRDFPILNEQVNGRPLVWLDNAATTQKPQAVIDRLSHFYEHENSNIHRAAHTLAARATDAYEAAREKVRRFLGAGSTDEIIFVRGATEGLNLIAKSWGWRHIGKDDEIIVTWLEHHANIVPWQQLCAEKGARLKVAPVDDSGQILLDEYEKLFTSRTKLVSLTQVSNALGTVTPAREMVEIAHRHGARAVVDGAQSVSHMAVDVQSLGCDFFVFSGHKVFGPTGIGAVYGRSDVLDETPPWQGGGNMIADVTFEKTLYQPPPHRFEAGTGNIADAVGLGAAIDYVETLGMANIARYEHELLLYATRGLQTIPGLTLIGTAKEKASVLSFTLDGWKTEEVGKALDKDGIAVRSGHHCAQPILRRFGLEATVRPSLAFYNTCEDVDALVAALIRLQSGR
ncbi:MAG TPA: family 2A encapsulin nanocompartment cargo protein cysteine desulfurase [Candidatus Sulfotelmatobacter sp.]|jgi:cysteine desulfurase/selenocysteine lyase|nr:family 2A encapsulin nanocompartment cargo protein cysteine desulfurase [Candidatus Sulfotelmatobacter sp.]